MVVYRSFRHQTTLAEESRRIRLRQICLQVLRLICLADQHRDRCLRLTATRTGGSAPTPEFGFSAPTPTTQEAAATPPGSPTPRGPTLAGSSTPAVIAHLPTASTTTPATSGEVPGVVIDVVPVTRPLTRLQDGIRKEKRYTDGTIRYGCLLTNGEPSDLADALGNNN